MPRLTEKERLALEEEQLKRLAATLRRRQHYMYRNRSGDYSIQDLCLIQFAFETAESLASRLHECLPKKLPKIPDHKSFLASNEQAIREDIVSGEDQDFRNLIQACTRTRPCHSIGG